MPELAPCGTLAAYRRHQRRRETPCYDCVQASQRAAMDKEPNATGRSLTPDPRPVRNNLPEFRPYVYRGTKRDLEAAS